MANAPEDIIELTDIIERGPGAPKADASASGGDLNFERELEDLFSDTAEPAGTKASDAMPGFDGLDLPDETGIPGEDIDLDGLDALLAEAGKSPSTAAKLEIPDDFMDMALGAQAHEPAASAAAFASAPASEEAKLALEALTARLDTLEAKFSGLGETLAQTFMPMVDEALAGFKAGLPAMPDAGELESRLDAKLEERLDSLKQELAPAPVAEPLDTAALMADVDARLEALKGEISEAAAMAETAAPVDPVPLVAELGERLEADIAALSGRVDELSGAQAAAPVAAAPADQTDLLAEVDARLEVFKAEAASQADALGERMSAELDEIRQGLAALEARIGALEATPEPAPFPEISEEDVPASETAGPDLSNLVTQDALDALRQELLAEIGRTVPAAAAQIIREEIRALVQEMGE
ncbi:hypothetical protein [Fundidesulfovibrio agrisoli]|uniref:hypothetical protein n=1 Tax=Fundidesulfovibrio agrisoli TaxID=2922717 RepID=UPI001FAB9D95|nr:hypothetical protein [Fundidesulfovibrio agrisoli]